jgi:DNA-binding MarR family transcriptional regulator
MLAARASPRVSEGNQADLLDAVREAQQSIVLRLIPQVVARGLSGHSFWPLFYLGRGHAQHPSDLARRLGITGPACTAAVDQLVRAGYVGRVPSETDRRQVLLSLTPKGRRLLDGVWREFDASLSSALESLPPRDVAVTARTLRALAGRLRAEPTPREGRA